MSIKNFNDNIGKRTNEFPACSAVSQQTASPRIPIIYCESTKSEPPVFIYTCSVRISVPEHATFKEICRAIRQYIYSRMALRERNYTSTREGLEVSVLTYKRHAKWKMLRGIYSTIYGEVNASVSGGYVLQYAGDTRSSMLEALVLVVILFLSPYKLVRPEDF